MPGRDLGQTTEGNWRRRRRLRALLLAAVLAGLMTLLTVGAAGADYWPHDPTPGAQQAPPA